MGEQIKYAFGICTMGMAYDVHTEKNRQFGRQTLGWWWQLRKLYLPLKTVHHII